MKRLLTILTIFILCTSCTKNKAQKKMTTDFQLTDCEAVYKGKPLPFNQPIEKWIELFGKDYRNIPDDSSSYYKRFIWDNLGVVVEEEGQNSNNARKTTRFYIFYSNLETPSGQRGKLKFANNRKSVEEILKQYTKDELADGKIEERIKNRHDLNGDEGPDKYIYPYKTYQQPVTIDGSEISKGLSLKDVNANRKDRGLQTFTFRDNNMDMINERETTKGDDGEYWDDHKKIDCANQDFYFFNSIQYSDYELEFIKIEYRTKDDKSPSI